MQLRHLKGLYVLAVLIDLYDHPNNHFNVWTIYRHPIEVTYCTRPLHLQASVLHMKKVSFLATITIEQHSILGLPWLKKHNPVLHWSSFCQQHCLEPQASKAQNL